MTQAPPPTRDSLAPTITAGSRRPVVAFGPVLAVGTAAAIFAASAGSLGWYRTEMLIAAALIIGAVLVLATVLLYRQSAEQRDTHRTLHEVEGRVGGIIASAMDAIITIDGEQQIVLFNKAAELVFGWSSQAVLGRKLDMLLPARFHAVHHQHIQHFGKTGVTSRRMGAKTVLTGVRASGEEFPVEASISHFGEGEHKLYTVILRDVTERVNTEQALRRSKEELHELADAANHLREQEKRAIARELHDELAQALTGLKMDVAWIKGRMQAPTPPQSILAKLDAMEMLLDSTVTSMRRIASDLRPMMLDDLGLVPAAEWLAQNFTERTGIRCHIAIANPDLELREPHATTLFRVLQESLTNIAKHAQASSVEVALDHGDGEIAIRVRDDGVGFSMQSPRKPNSYGLIGLRERAYLLGGTVTIDSTPGRGTLIEVRLPLAEGAR
jgi:PAS domain S-box-containing protein